MIRKKISDLFHDPISQFIKLLAALPPGMARADIVVNEVMSNPLTEGNEEFIELYNTPGAGAIDVAGWQFTDGDALAEQVPRLYAMVQQLST